MVLQATFASTSHHTKKTEYFKQKNKVKLKLQGNEKHWGAGDAFGREGLHRPVKTSCTPLHNGKLP